MSIDMDIKVFCFVYILCAYNTLEDKSMKLRALFQILFVFQLLFFASQVFAQRRDPPGGLIPPGRDRADCGALNGGLVAGPPDPGAPGVFDVGSALYNLDPVTLPGYGDQLVETEAVIFYPRPLSCGPFPIVLMLHGQHASCINDNGNPIDQWPCDPAQTIDNYRGYDYLGERLASNGIVAVSISANSINANGSGPGNADLARAELIQHHLGILEQLNATDKLIFGDLLVGHLDLDRIGTMGHSRGGEGVILHAGINSDDGSPYGLRAILTVAGTQTTDTLVNDIPVATLHAYCDGDLEGLASTGYFDGARYNFPGDMAAKHSFLVLGANHNFFNTLWDPNLFNPGGFDDWENNWFNQDGFCLDTGGRLSSSEQQGSLMALAGAYFRVYLQNRRNFLSFLKGDVLPPPSAMTDQIFMGYHPPDDPDRRLDINTVDEFDNDVLNSLGGFTGSAGFLVSDLCDPDITTVNGCLNALPPGFTTQERVPHFANDYHKVQQLRLAWNTGTPRWENRIPDPFRDISRFRYVQFRAFVDFTDPLNAVGQEQDLSIEIEDDAGRTSRVTVSDHSRSLFYPPSAPIGPESVTSVPRAILNTVRVPLGAFNEVYLTDIRSMRLVFDRTEQGAINVTDFALADEANNLSPAVVCSVNTPVLEQPNNQFVNVGLQVTTSDPDDSGIALIDVDVFSDEDDVDSQQSQTSPDALNIAPATLELRAERDANGDGRVYLVTARAADQDGATGFGCCAVTVPFGDDSAEIQAATALNRCARFVAAGENLMPPPDGYYLIGDGPSLP